MEKDKNMTKVKEGEVVCNKGVFSSGGLVSEE